ncbi:prepilin-type N-terminal cleavage/methylation domain-containing protein [Glaciimonas sp. CA11.2]|uniref:GspH/FimT family pseudopilin n=1 Tax=Glaciimonas sp. CA11.2 TaxID=3048601 RepID=UPI002AB3D8C1|nr:prepilin-type N-terminal cleavage/methylation domain-containing protein [Glaciimonas sp. CA11.2]MDY7547913.1 prepilin-type N-terminal cleavage/methylation domain-containing protein [Glaciimonas sp. CA11.2]MEB0164153.1 prepilin-type N-terminal cleavage/methylation domain-containing protein [Glaciimonas sp. CA11.2]
MTISKNSNGFTLIELVMVIVITGVIAVVAIPRFSGRQTFQARGFYDQTLSMLRYAQKIAIAQHTPTFVNVSSVNGTICLTYLSDINCINSDAKQVVLGPSDQQKFSKVTPNGITIESTNSSFFFSALGKPSPDATVQLSIVGDGMKRIITVERETGYVH